MFDMRYHIVSLVAVFLALAIGIMLGSSIENRGMLKQQQERLVKSIEEDIAAIKNKNTVLQKQLASQREFEDKVLPSLIKGKLKKSKVAIVYFTDASSNTLKTAVAQTLEQAEAYKQEIALDRASLANKSDIEELALELSKSLGLVLTRLQKESGLKLASDFLPLNSVVMFAGGKNSSSEELALAKALKKNKIKVVFIDKSDNQFSKIDKFIEADIDTVDNIDMVYGRLSMVYLLQNLDSGHFGVRTSAEELMPAFE